MFRLISIVDTSALSGGCRESFHAGYASPPAHAPGDAIGRVYPVWGYAARGSSTVNSTPVASERLYAMTWPSWYSAISRTT